MQNLAYKQTFSDKGNLARLVTTQRVQGSGGHIAEQLWECRRILSKVGLYKRIILMRESAELRAGRLEWDEILEKLYGEPISIRNRVVWLFFHACLQAERDFALDVCSAHSREDVLTGRLLEGIKGACSMWAGASSSYLNRVKNTLEVGGIDLTVGGGEQETGGDFALILDIKEHISCDDDLSSDVVALTGGPQGDIFVPLLFQAKCYVGERADISQKHSVRGYQFNRLRQANCASNYIFYNNGSQSIEYPALPMVKSTLDCDSVESSRNTGVFDRSVNFSTYMLMAVNGFEGIPVAKTREDALNMILANSSPSVITKIAIFGNAVDLSMRYQEALSRLREEIELQNEMGSSERQELSQEDDASDAPTSRFEP